MRQRFLALLAALPLAVTGPATATGTAAAAATCNAADSAIYTPPGSVTGNAGDVIACEPVTLPKVSGNVPMKAWKVQYVSTDVAGRKIAVSGTVAVPTAAWTGGGNRPVVAFNPGTLGLGSQCAFSKQLAGAYQDEYEGDQIGAILQKGYAVAATDGVGYLNGQVHPYVVGQDAGHAVLNAARVAFNLPGSGLTAGAPVGLWGYSEGGQASLWAAQLAASYAPDLKVAGAVAGGVPGDLRVVAATLNGSAFAGFAADAVIGLHTAYPDEPFDSILNATGRQAIKTAESECLVGTLASFTFADISDFTTDHLTLDQLYALKAPSGVSWGDVVDAQRLGVGIGPAGSGAEYTIGFPVFQFRGALEEIIPQTTEDATHKAYCDAHIATRWTNTYPGDHLLTDGLATSDEVSLLADRFAGKPFTGNC